MEAKDTVMSSTEIDTRLANYAINFSSEDMVQIQKIAQLQADISFKEGIKEVGGLTSRLLKAAKAGECPDPTCRICAEKNNIIKEAEAKLKEWGVECKQKNQL